jgi:hypothetical protein
MLRLSRWLRCPVRRHRDPFAMGNLPTNGTPYIVTITTTVRKDETL